jgi:hypothetical protein
MGCPDKHKKESTSMAIVQHLWTVDWLGRAVHIVGPLFHDIAEHGMPTLLGFIGF